MPRIQEYTAQSDTLRPTEVGVDATAQAARRVGTFYDQAAQSEKGTAADMARAGEGLARAEDQKFSAFGNVADSGAMFGKSIGGLVQQAQDSEGHQEISHGAATAATAGATLIQQLNQVANSADPNDTTVGAKFLEGTFEPWADTFRQGFQTDAGQRFAEGQIASLRDHLVTTAAGDMSKRSGQAILGNLDKMGTSSANAAFIDPTAVPFLLQNSQRSIDAVIATSPNLNADDAAHARFTHLDTIQRSIVRAGALGVVQNARDPEAALKAYVARYPDMVDAEEIEHLGNAARGVAHINQQDADGKQGIAQQNAIDDYQSKAGDLMNSANVASGNPQLPSDYWSRFKQLTVHSGQDASTRQDAFELGRALTFRAKTNTPDPDPATSHATAMDMVDQLRAGKLSAGDVYRAYGNAKLNGTDLAMIDGKLKSMQTPDGQALDRREAGFMQSVAPAITRGLGDQDAKLRMYDLQNDVERRVADYRKAGKNPADLFDRSNPNYVGNAGTIAGYRTSLQSTLPTLATGKTPAATAAVPMREKGETLTAWMARTGHGFGPAPAATPSVPMSQ